MLGFQVKILFIIIFLVFYLNFVLLSNGNENKKRKNINTKTKPKKKISSTAINHIDNNKNKKQFQSDDK